MRWYLTMIVFTGFAMTVQGETFVYVSVTPAKKIQIYQLDQMGGKLTAVDAQAVDGLPGSLGVDPDRKYLFASLRPNATLVSFHIDPATGKLKPLSTAPLGKGEMAAFVGTDRTGRWLLSAAYMAGKVVVHGINPDGSIKTPPVETVTTTKTAHSCFPDPANRWIFVPHVDPNAVYQYRFDAATGKLTDAGKASGGAEKAGPRHLAFHPTLGRAYTSNELGNSITAYEFNPDTGLKPVQTLSTLPADYKGRNTTADVKIHPNGKFVWVSNRGHDSLAGFRIDAKSGELASLGQTPTEKTPRSIAIDPDGQFLFGAGEASGKLAVYRIDTGTGALTRIHTYDVSGTGTGLGWVLVVKMGK